jgi:ABC-type antimicrobial peptide transport system permease subunit
MIPISYSVRSLARRPLTSIVTVGGLSLVVFVLAAMMMLSHGVHDALAKNGSPNNALILRDGATSEAVSAISRDQFRLLEGFPEIATNPQGNPLIAGEVVVISNLPRADAAPNTPGANVGVRGIMPTSLAIRDTVKLVKGRLPRPGTLEVMVGLAVEGRYAGSHIDESLSFARRQWPVVGVFSAEGSAFESEIWGDEQSVADAFNRQGFSDAVLRLKDPDALSSLDAKVAADPALSSLKPWREDRFFDAQSETLRSFIVGLGTFVTIIFAIAAGFGATVTMYSQVSNRLREIGTLRAIGFRRLPVLSVFLREAILLSLISGIIGVAAASLMSLVSFSALNQQSFTQITFHFHFTPDVVIVALIFSVAMGVIGGFLPALSAARQLIVNAVRAR